MSVFSGPLAGDHDSEAADAEVRSTPADTPDTGIPLGNSLGAGDLDGDGHADLAVGAYTYSTTGKWLTKGAVFVYFGPFSGSLGIPDADVTVVGEEEDVALGGELDGGHDLDGDGQDDLLVGSSYIEVNGQNTNISTGGLSNAWLFAGPLSSGTVLASEAVAHWSVDDDYFGLQARVAGDTDGDGHPEVLIGTSGNGYLFAPAGD